MHFLNNLQEISANGKNKQYKAAYIPDYNFGTLKINYS